MRFTGCPNEAAARLCDKMIRSRIKSMLLRLASAPSSGVFIDWLALFFLSSFFLLLFFYVSLLRCDVPSISTLAPSILTGEAELQDSAASITLHHDLVARVSFHNNLGTFKNQHCVINQHRCCSGMFRNAAFYFISVDAFCILSEWAEERLTLCRRCSRGSHYVFCNPPFFFFF